MIDRDLADQYWKNNEGRWQYALDHYDGTYAIRELYRGRITEYLHQKYQRENQKAYEERQKVTDPVLHFGTVIDSINGVLSSKADETIREFGDLGDPEQVGSNAYQLFHDADGEGTNWRPFFKQVGIKLTVLHEVWGYVKGVTDTDPCVKIINPRNVISRYPVYGHPQEVLIYEQKDMTRQGGKQDEDVYTRFTLDGWEQFRLDDDTKIIIDSGEYAFYQDQSQQQRILPVFKTQIPMPRPVGFLLALKENHIYNQKSVRDFALRNMSFAILKLATENKEQFDGIINDLEKGANVIPEYGGVGTHSFMSPESSYLQQAQSIFEKDVEDFYINAFKRYGEAARQVTATQIKLESHSGIEAFLSLLTQTIDEFENQALWRLEQVYFPGKPSRWGKASVERATSFQPEEIPNAKELAEIAVNLERSQAASIETIVQTLHPAWTEEEITEEVARIKEQRSMSIPDSMLDG